MAYSCNERKQKHASCWSFQESRGIIKQLVPPSIWWLNFRCSLRYTRRRRKENRRKEKQVKTKGRRQTCNFYCYILGETGGNHTFVWADDSFMGMALLSRLAILYLFFYIYFLFCFFSPSPLPNLIWYYSLNNPTYLTTIVNQQLTYTQHLQDAIDGIYHHGYNNEDHHQSCCKWSRGIFCSSSFLFLSPLFFSGSHRL